IPTLPAIGALALIYFVAGKLSLQLAFLHKSASPVWPPAGIALAALLVLGFRVWPALFVGAFLVNLTTLGNIWTSLGIASGNTLEALCGAWLVNRFAGGARVFDRPQDVFKFALAALIGTTVSPTFGVSSLAAGGFAQWSSYWHLYSFGHRNLGNAQWIRAVHFAIREPIALDAAVMDGRVDNHSNGNRSCNYGTQPHPGCARTAKGRG